MYVNAKAEFVTLAPDLRPERRFAPLARGLNTVYDHEAPETKIEQNKTMKLNSKFKTR